MFRELLRLRRLPIICGALLGAYVAWPWEAETATEEVVVAIQAVPKVVRPGGDRPRRNFEQVEADLRCVRRAEGRSGGEVEEPSKDWMCAQVLVFHGFWMFLRGK